MEQNKTHKCKARCYDCKYWTYYRDKYRYGRCSLLKKDTLGIRIACEHLKTK